MAFKQLNPAIGDNPAAREDQHEYSQQYLTRNRRILFLRGPIIGAPTRNDSSGPTWIGDDIMALTLEDQTKPITLVVESGGGDITAGLILYDIIRMCAAPITTVVTNAASMGTIIGAAGATRLCLPHSKFMIHLPSAAFTGTEREIDTRSKMLTNLKNDLISCYIECGVTAGLPASKRNEGAIRKQILKDIDSIEKWMSAEDAIKYGLIDRVATTTELFGVG